MIEKIVVPVDFSEQSLQALRYTYQINQEIGARVIMLHIVEDHNPKIKDPASPHIQDLVDREDYKKACSEMSKLIQPDFKHAVDIDYHVVNDTGRLSDQIVSEANHLDADLIAMGTRGANSLTDYIWGSTTTRVIDQAEIPVLAIPLNAQFDGDIDDLVFGVSYESFSDDIFNEVNFLREAFQARLTCLDVNIAHNPMLEKRQSDLEEKFGSSGISFEIVDAMDVSDAIVDWSRDNNVDFIIMHAAKRKGLDKLFNRSYTENLIFHTRIPVLAL